MYLYFGAEDNSPQHALDAVEGRLRSRCGICAGGRGFGRKHTDVDCREFLGGRKEVGNAPIIYRIMKNGRKVLRGLV
jgi:hypothetical protein